MAFQRCSIGFKSAVCEGCSATQIPCNSNHSLPISAYNSTKSLREVTFFDSDVKEKTK